MYIGVPVEPLDVEGSTNEIYLTPTYVKPYFELYPDVYIEQDGTIDELTTGYAGYDSEITKVVYLKNLSSSRIAMKLYYDLATDYSGELYVDKVNEAGVSIEDVAYVYVNSKNGDGSDVGSEVGKISFVLEPNQSLRCMTGSYNHGNNDITGLYTAMIRFSYEFPEQEEIVTKEIAKKVNKMYIGVDGVAKQVEKAYIGDANGIARCVYDVNNV